MEMQESQKKIIETESGYLKLTGKEIFFIIFCLQLVD